MEVGKKISATKVPYGKPVKLLVDSQGYPDGRLVQFEIWRKRGSNEEKACEVYGVTKGGKAIGTWNPKFKKRANHRPLKKEKQVVNTEEKYFFIARIDDQEVKSSDIIFVYPLKIFLKDIDGNPLDGVKCKIKLSDGSTRQTIFNKGVVEIKDAPIGKFEVELDEECEIIDEE